MALLQIAEPGKSAAPHQHRLAVGIDLGTTHSLVAAVQSGANRVLLDECGQALLPSVVRYHADASVTVGINARARQSEDPHNTIVSVKRLMGRGLDDLSETARRPYRFSATPGMVRLDTIAGERTPVEVSAEILKSLRARAERALGGELVGAVITVPAYFDDAQRQATKDAARLAGINVLRLLNEPTAAAVAYGLDHAAEGVFAIYDLGGGTFDISILRLSRGVFEVLATNGDSALGGDDFDQCIVDWLLAQTNSATPDARGARRLLAEARTAKEALTTQPQVDIVVPGANGTTQTIQLTRATFDEITRALVEKTLQPVRKALRDAGLKVLDIDATVLVGGSTRMPAVQAAVAAFFGKPPRTDLDPDQVVALGAAIQADALAGNRSDEWLLLDVIPLSLGLETLGGLTEKIIPRNSPIPAARAQDFTTYKDGQTALLVHVLQGERETVEHCRSLARFELRGIPPMTAGAARVRVTFQVDADGLLTVSARENRTGVEAVVAVKPSYGLNDDDIARMLADSQRHAQEDSEARALREQRVDSQQLLDMTHSALAADGARLLDTGERAAIEQAMEALRNALAGSERVVLRAATEALNRVSSEFAARRMDSAVRAALTGHKLAELEI